jgi:hypothetical protein
MFIYFLNREYGRRTLGEEIIELIQRSSRKYLVALFKALNLVLNIIFQQKIWVHINCCKKYVLCIII